MLFLLLQYFIAGHAVSDCSSTFAVPVEQTAVLLSSALLVELDRNEKKEEKQSCSS